MIEVITALIALAVIGAIVAVHSSTLLYSVISVGAVGFLVAIAFVFLSAPDVAIVQIGVEVISLVILIRATIGRDVKSKSDRGALTVMVAGVTLLAIIGVLTVRVVGTFPEFGSPVMERIAQAPATTYLHDSLAVTGAPNTVTAVLLDFRGYDTLGEATVLFCAVLGVSTILRRRARRRAEQEDDST